jgi:uncharacterized protein (DUF488 family)
VNARRVWTIGYEGHDPESFVSTLRKARIERVVDVRELPLSRKAGFSKNVLAAGLQRAGIAYSHAKALGTPRPVRHALKAGGSVEDFRRDYLAHLRENMDAVEELERVASGERCALLCVERELETCHRGVLAEVLEQRGWTAEHI